MNDATLGGDAINRDNAVLLPTRRGGISVQQQADTTYRLDRHLSGGGSIAADL